MDGLTADQCHELAPIELIERHLFASIQDPQQVIELERKNFRARTFVAANRVSAGALAACRETISRRQRRKAPNRLLNVS